MHDLKETIQEYLSTSFEKTKSFGKNFSKKLKKGDIICLFGDLGAGKTTLVKGIANGVNNTKESAVTSPTFTYLNIYPGKVDLYHFDLYRLKDEKDFISMGFSEYFEKDGICILEWSEKITKIIPKNAYMVHLLFEEENKRKITILEL